MPERGRIGRLLERIGLLRPRPEAKPEAEEVRLISTPLGLAAVPPAGPRYGYWETRPTRAPTRGHDEPLEFLRMQCLACGHSMQEAARGALPVLPPPARSVDGTTEAICPRCGGKMRLLADCPCCARELVVLEDTVGRFSLCGAGCEAAGVRMVPP